MNSTEWPYVDETKSLCQIEAFRRLKEHGLNGVGLELNMTDAAGGFVHPKHVSRFMDRIGDAGGLVEITELQLGLTRGSGDDDYRFQAWLFGGIWDACLQHTNCLSVVVRSTCLTAGLPRADFECSLQLHTTAGKSGMMRIKPHTQFSLQSRSVQR